MQRCIDIERCVQARREDLAVELAIYLCYHTFILLLGANTLDSRFGSDARDKSSM